MANNKKSKVDGQGNIKEKATLFKPDAPRTTPVLPDVSAGFTSIVQIARDILINPDIAYRTDRRLSEQMIRDPMVMGPLTKRMLATAQLEWEIVPEDEEGKDSAQVAMENKPFFPSLGGEYDPKIICKKVENIIRRMPRKQDFFRELLWGVFRGTGVSEVYWNFDPQESHWWLQRHRPHNGDKITYDVHGNPRILTRAFQTGGRELDDGERDRLIIHTYDPDDGSFYDGAEAGYIFKGRGLRDLIWPYWWLKHNALKFWVTFLQRYGMGNVAGRYPMGNIEAKDAIESVLKNIAGGDAMFSVPVPGGAEDKEIYGIEFQKMMGVGESASVFKEFVDDWAGRHIRILIEGQDQAHQTTGDGLGSGRAEALERTFEMYRNYDATALADTLSEQLVKRIVYYNFGDIPVRLKFKFLLEKPNYEETEKRIDGATKAKLRVAKKDLYEMLDLRQPTDDEDCVDFGAQADPMAGMGGIFGGGNPGDAPPADENDEEARALFREALRERYIKN